MTNTTNTLHILPLSMLLAASVVACGEAPTDTDAQLSAAAAALAPVLNDESFRDELARRLNERSTGDYEVFLADLTYVTLSDGRTVGEVVEPTGILDNETVHIAAPQGVPEGGGPPSIAWLPANQEPASLQVYHPDGTSERIATDVEPDERLLVLGLNERVLSLSAPEGPVHAWWGTCLGCKSVKMDRIRILTTSEPWYKGDPEIYVKCFSSPYANPRLSHDGAVGSLELENVNDTGVYYTVNRHLMTISPSWSYDPVCWVMERDGGPGSLVGAADPDDIIGYVTVRIGDPSPKTYVAGKSDFRLSANGTTGGW